MWDTVGPQHALFVPAPLLRDGANAVRLLELDPAHVADEVHFTDRPRWDAAPAAGRAGAAPRRRRRRG